VVRKCKLKINLTLKDRREINISDYMKNLSLGKDIFLMGSSNSEVASWLVYLKFLFLAITYGLYGSLYCSIPFVFYRPDLDCLDSSGVAFSCSLEQACSNFYGYVERNSDYP